MSLDEVPQFQLNWYKQLITDCKSIIRKGRMGIVNTVVEMKHALGRRLAEDELKLKRAEYGSRQIEGIADDLGVSKTTLYDAMEFYKLWKDLPSFYMFVQNQYLPLAKKENGKADFPPSVGKIDAESIAWKTVKTQIIPLRKKGTWMELKDPKQELMKVLLRKYIGERWDLEALQDILSVKEFRGLIDLKVRYPETSFRDLYYENIALMREVSVKVPMGLAYGLKVAMTQGRLDRDTITLVSGDKVPRAYLLRIIKDYLEERNVTYEDCLNRAKEEQLEFR